MNNYAFTDYRHDIKILSELRSGNDTIFINGEPNSDRMFRKGISDTEYESILQNRIAEYELKNPIAISHDYSIEMQLFPKKSE